jgi:hypothetical protein
MAEVMPDSRSGTPGADTYKVKGNLHWVSGMAVPALVYWAINAGDAVGMRGWAVPMATRHRLCAGRAHPSRRPGTAQP